MLDRRHMLLIAVTLLAGICTNLEAATPKDWPAYYEPQLLYDVSGRTSTTSSVERYFVVSKGYLVHRLDMEKAVSAPLKDEDDIPVLYYIIGASGVSFVVGMIVSAIAFR